MYLLTGLNLLISKKVVTATKTTSEKGFWLPLLATK